MKTRQIIFLFSLLAWSASASDFIVMPSDRATQSGNISLFDGFNGPGSLQLVYGAADFSQPVMITGVSFRADEGTGGASVDATVPRLTIELSTYQGTLASFRSFYSQNQGPDNKTVFDGSVHWATKDLSGGVPNPFDLTISFSQPFPYDPSAGPLIMHYVLPGSFAFGINGDAHAHGDPAIGWLSGEGALAGADFSSVATRFDVIAVPKPSEMILFGIGLAATLRKEVRV